MSSLLALWIFVAMAGLGFSAHGEDKKPEGFKIVSLDPSLTEVLFSLNLGEYVVGTSDLSDHPEAAKKIARVGRYGKPDVEKILLLKPTHIVVLKEGINLVKNIFEKAGLRQITLMSRDLKDFESLVAKLGDEFNRVKEAKKLLRTWSENWHRIQALKKLNRKKHPRVLIQVDRNPLVMAGRETFISSALETCGVANALSPQAGYLKSSVENLVETKPDVIIVMQMSEESRAQIKEFWHTLPNFRQTPLLNVSASDLGRLSPRFPKFIESICRQIRSGILTAEKTP